MRRRRNDFKTPQRNSEAWYDLFEDWDLIVSSFAEQYNIRLRQELSSMPYAEFCALRSGISSETAIGRIVSIRSEKNKERLKYFTPEERRIRSEWQKRRTVNMSESDFKQSMLQMAAAFRNL